MSRMKSLSYWQKLKSLILNCFLSLDYWRRRTSSRLRKSARDSELFNKTYGEDNMLSKNFFLQSSFKESGVVNPAFPYLMISDTLAAALIVLEFSGLNRVVILDQNKSLAGILDKESILREFTPPNSINSRNIILQRRTLLQRSCESIRDISSRTLNSIEHIIRKPRTFKENELIVYGFRFLLNSGYHLADDLLAITDQDSRVIGTVSGKNLLSYIFACVNSEVFSKSIKLALAEHVLPNLVAVHNVNDPLKIGWFALNHSPAVCILLERKSRVIGFLTREMIGQQIHPLYSEMLKFPMEMFMQPLDESSNVINSNQNLSDLNQFFMKNSDEFIILHNSNRQSRTQLSKSTENYHVLSIKSFLNLVCREAALSL